MPGTHLCDFFLLVHETFAEKKYTMTKAWQLYIMKKLFRVKKCKIDDAVCTEKSENDAGDRDT